MVSLVDIYNIKESSFSEIKDHGDPARGNKGKDREREYYFIDEPADPETGGVKSKVVYKRSFTNMVKDIEAEAIDMQKLSNEHPDDMVIHNLAVELKEIFNTFRTHVRKNYKGAFIGSGRNSGKQLVFKKSKRNPKGIEAVHGASLPRDFERQDMAKIFNKKIKTRLPILFKRASDFHLM